MAYTVYKHTSPSKKVYIGITQQLTEKRWKKGLGYKRQKHFFNAIQKYGWDNFTHEILFTDLTKEEAEQKEIELIRLYDSTNRDFGYNSDNGGNSIGKHSNETRRKISESNKGQKPSPQTLEAISKAHKGKHLSDETKRMISESNKGKVISDETKRKIGEKNREKGKPIVQIENGFVINHYKNSIDASEKTGIPSSCIRRCCLGERKTAGGYKWGYFND